MDTHFDTIEQHLDRLKRDLTTIKWMLAANLAIEIAIFFKVFSR